MAGCRPWPPCAPRRSARPGGGCRRGPRDGRGGHEGRHFCIDALAAVLPLLPARQRTLPAGDWLERENEVACPDPEERLIMRIERTGTSHLRSADLM